VRDFGAFVDVGVCKDGLLHASEMLVTGRVIDAREHLAVGEQTSVTVKTIYEGKLTLTCRPVPSRPQPAAPVDVSSLREPSAAAKAAMVRRDVDAALWAQQAAERAQQAAERAQQAAERAAQQAAVDAAASAAAEEAAERLRLAALPWEALTAAVNCGKPIPLSLDEAPPRVLVNRLICGKECRLYDMPWKY